MRKTNPTTLAGGDGMPITYTTPGTMSVTQSHPVLTTHVMPDSAVLNPGFLTKGLGISAPLSTFQGISEQRPHM